MICTLFSIVLILFFLFLPSTSHLESPSPSSLNLLFTAVGALFVLIFAIINILILQPLQTAEKNATPRLMQLLKKDRRLIFINAGILLFALLNFVYAFHPFPVSQGTDIPFLIWILLAGISLDLLHDYFKRISSYMNPFAVVNLIGQEARNSIIASRDEELCDWINSLTEIATKAADRHSSVLCTESIGEIQTIAKLFMESCKSIGHTSPEKSKDQGKDTEEILGKDADEVNFLLFYILQRLEFIFEKALQNHLEPVCSAIISSLGKITLHAAKFDLSLAAYPIHFIGKLTVKAQEKGIPEIGIKATLTLLEVSKTILSEIDYTYLDLKEPFIGVITQLDDIAKTTFKKDKGTSLALLTQPFLELKQLFQTEKAMQHRDRGEIVTKIDRILGEYEALEAVLKTIPPITELQKDI